MPFFGMVRATGEGSGDKGKRWRQTLPTKMVAFAGDSTVQETTGNDGSKPWWEGRRYGAVLMVDEDLLALVVSALPPAASSTCRTPPVLVLLSAKQLVCPGKELACWHWPGPRDWLKLHAADRVCKVHSKTGFLSGCCCKPRKKTQPPEATLSKAQPSPSANASRLQLKRYTSNTTLPSPQPPPQDSHSCYSTGL